jgi:tripartite-type tricarboxylate transporter receptor subunit TctC
MWRFRGVFVLALAACCATAQDFPTKPIRFVLTAVAGPGDSVGRLIAPGLTERLRQQIIIDGRSGANGTIATDIVAKANPDGYTFLLSTNSFAITPSMYRKLPFDSVRDLAPVTLIATAGGLVMIVHPAVPVTSVKELIELDKANPGKISFGSAGVGNVTHMAGELFNMMAGTKLFHVPYKSAAPALMDLLGGHVSVMFPGTTQVLPHVKAGRVRAIGFTGMARSKVLPEVPTLDELGLKGFDIASWFGLFAPAKIPPRVLNYMRDNVAAVVKDRSTSDMLDSWGLTPVGSMPDEFRVFLKKDMERYVRIVREAKIPQS